MNVTDSHEAPVDASWWSRPDLQDALTNRDIAAIFHFLRRHGFSQTRIAALTRQNQSEVSAILAHHRQITAYDVLARIADGLGIPRGLMGLAYTAAVPPIWDRAAESTQQTQRRRTPLLRLPPPPDQRPANRLLRLGAPALSDAELVAILLTTGTRNHDALTHAQHLLHQIGGVAGLTRHHPEHLTKIDGLSPTKAARLLAALALPTRAHDSETTIIGRPDDLVPILRPLLHGLRHERFVVAICDRRARVTAVRTISDGGSDNAPFMIRDILATVLRHDGHAFAIAHNHPSGDPTPSIQDHNATARIHNAAQTTGLTFLYHLILGTGDTWSSA